MLSVVIPAYNEEHTLASVVEAVNRVPIPKEIVVVNDGSTDQTGRVLEDLHGRYPLRAIHLPTNRGKGYAIRAALKVVQGDAVIIQDADLENDPMDYLHVVLPILAGDAQVVYGSRFLRGPPPMSRLHYLANRVLALLVNALFHVHITDESTCYKAFDTSVLRSLRLTCQGFEFCPEVTSKVLRAGYQIHEVPISYTPRTRAQGKKLRYGHDGLLAVWTLVKYRLAPRSRIFRREADLTGCVPPS